MYLFLYKLLIQLKILVCSVVFFPFLNLQTKEETWSKSKYEPPRDKTNNVAVHPPSLIRAFAVRSVGS